MIDLLSASAAARLVGVIDLKDHQAVHAVAGNRDQYQPVRFCDGDPQRLAEHYLRIGLREFYVADLNAIGGSAIAVDAIDRICSRVGEARVLVDIGWSGGPATDQACRTRGDVAELSEKFPMTQWIAATEAMQSRLALGELAQLIPNDRLLIGLDFKGDVLSGRHRVADWIDEGLQLGIAGAVILDLGGIGTESGPTTRPQCKTVHDLAPHWTIYSGGGIRDAQDVDSLIAVGCNRCLVATAIHGIL